VIPVRTTGLRDVDVAGDLLVGERLDAVAKQLLNQPCRVLMKRLNLRQMIEDLKAVDNRVNQWSLTRSSRNDRQWKLAAKVLDDVQCAPGGVCVDKVVSDQ
jgi:hypothetical protein